MYKREAKIKTNDEQNQEVLLRKVLQTMCPSGIRILSPSPPPPVEIAAVKTQ